MNKKSRLILGISIVVVLFIYILFYSSGTYKVYEVSEAVAARETFAGNSPITVNGTLIPGTDKWDPLNNTLTFKMTDGIATMDVVYIGDKPNMAAEAVSIQAIVTGQFNNKVFEAFKMLTKCPSKYEGENSFNDTQGKVKN
ncbi:MAG: cytochrome c maturation protein CcmE [Candidatus Methanoperedens sp.]|nr:cytochrome c maturation protein CcmE [Candidatus Methanoperedens sp.]